MLDTNSPSVFETLCGGRPLVPGARPWGRRALELQHGVLHPQGPQEFDEGPVHCPIMGPPSQDTDGEGAAPQPGQNHTCLGKK